MGVFSEVFTGQKSKAPPEGLKGLKGSKGGLLTLKTLLAPHWPYENAADEPRCTSCRNWQVIPGKTWPKTGERMGDCLLHGFDALEMDNCKLHDAQSGHDET